MTKFLILLLFVFVSSAQAGKSVGGGSDSTLAIYNEHSAWFLTGNANNQKGVTYCLKVDPAFGKGADELNQNILRAVREWHNYFKANRNTSPITDIPTGHEIDIDFKFVYQNRCSESTELVFYFGASDSRVEKAKANYLAPISFANKESYDDISFRSKGLIWFAMPNSISYGKKSYPKWEVPTTLYGAMLHEIGHVFGLAHIYGTIMREDLSDLVRYAGEADAQRLEYYTAKLSSIGDTRHPFQLNDGVYRGQLSPGSDNGSPFEFFMGRRPKGKVRATYTYARTKELNVPSKRVLTIADDVGSRDFSIDLQTSMNSSGCGPTSSERLINGMYVSPEATYCTLGMGVTSGNGQSIAILVSENRYVDQFNTSEAGPVSLDYFHDGKASHLFDSEAPGFHFE